MIRIFETGDTHIGRRYDRYPEVKDHLTNGRIEALQGTVCEAEYHSRAKICADLLSGFLTCEVDDSELSEEISIDKIRSEFAETSFAAKFMERLMDSPTELQMACQRLTSCKEE